MADAFLSCVVAGFSDKLKGNAKPAVGHPRQAPSKRPHAPS